MKIYMALAALFLFFTPAQAAEDFDVNGDRLGMSLEVFKSKYDKSFFGIGRSAVCAPIGTGHEAKAGVVSCAQSKPPSWQDKFLSTFEGAAANINYHFFHEKLFRIVITLDSAQFEAVVRNLTARNGSPSSARTEKYVARLGVPFENRIVEWRHPQTSIAATKFAASISQSSIIVLHDELNEELAATRDSLGVMQASSSR